MTAVAVIGGGAWGTALATVAAVNGPVLPVAGRAPAMAPLPPGAAAILAVPAQRLGEVVARHRAALAGAVLVIAAKGIERASGRLLTEVVEDRLPGAASVVLSGPSFAAETAAGLPTAVALAAGDGGLARRLAARLATGWFRPYVSADPVGVQIGGALKNVVAIACGIVVGRGLGENARAAVMTRSLAEMGRLTRALGGDPRTLMGLAGLGDLALSCASPRSRNFAAGLALGRGEPVGPALAEGVETASAAVGLSRRLGVEMPIAEAVAAVLNGAAIEAEMARLLARPLTGEE